MDESNAPEQGPRLPRTLHASLETGPFRLRALADDAPQPAIPGFRIGQRLGEGGMGVVYRAVQESLRREVALKVISPRQAGDRAFCERFLREARAAATVTHPNLVSCFDVGEADGHLYMVLELITGGDAARLALRSGGRLEEAEALRIASDCCRGLAALHRAGIVHRDVKPANIYLAQDGAAKLGDFGLAHVDGVDHLTRTGTPVGTPAFMAPEQVRADPHLDGRADLYALGASLYALVTGGAPYVATSPWGVLVAVLNDPVPDARAQRPALSDGLAAVIARAMSKERSQRYRTAEELLADLEAVSGGARPLTRMPSLRRPTSAPISSADAPTRRMRPPGSWRRRGVIAAAVVAASAASWALLAPLGAAAANAEAASAVDAPRWETVLRAAGLPCVAHERAGQLAIAVNDPQLESLDALTGVPAERLDLSGCRALRGDLSALTGMRLRSLRLAGCALLTSLNGIQGMPLEELDCSGCTALAGSPTQLRGMPLRRLSFADCARLAGLDGLQGMPLEALDLTGCAALRGDLLPLRGTRLATLDLEGCAHLTSLDGIAELPLERLRIAGCKRLADVSALSRLSGCAVLHDAKDADAGPVNATMVDFRW